MVEQMIGSRAQVMNGTAHHTKGGLTKKGLMYNKHGRIVSRKKHTMGKKTIKHLYKLGYKPKKGSFKLFKKGHGSKKMKGGTGNAVGMGNVGAPLDRALLAGGRRRSRRMSGGGMYPLSPSPISGISNTSGVALQFMAGNATG
jgi:hypothetical protein